MEEYIESCMSFIKYISKCYPKHNIEEILLNNLKNSFYNNKNMSNQFCGSIIKSGKRKGEKCNKPTNGEMFCKIHNSKSVVSHPIVEDTSIVIRKNKYHNFVYGNTGLIFKSVNDKYIVAREGENGKWEELDEEDIEKCKKYNLKYKKISLEFKGETSTIEYSKNIKLVEPIVNEEKEQKTKESKKKKIEYLEDE